MVVGERLAVTLTFFFLFRAMAKSSELCNKIGIYKMHTWPFSFERARKKTGTKNAYIDFVPSIDESVFE